jgi:predicted  nucleic acid-binding Zn-ribbon protein
MKREARIYTPLASRPKLNPINYKEVIMSKRDEYIAKFKLQLDDLNAKMNELEAKAKVAKEDARDKYKEEMDKMHKQSALVMAKLDEIKAAGEDSWETMVGELEKIRDAYIHSFHYFKSQL